MNILTLFLVLCNFNYLTNIVGAPLEEEDDDYDLAVEKTPEWANLVEEHRKTHNVPLAESERKVYDKDGNIDITDVPYLISIQRKLKSGKILHDCGGSIIRNDVILTAAHCVKGYRPEFLQIRAGSSLNHTGGVVVDVARFVYHEKYRFGFDKSFDVGVIYLSKPLEYSDTIKPIPIANKDEELDVNTLMSVSGFGYDNHTVWSFADTLQAVVVPLTDQATCETMYRERHTPITSTMLCAGYQNGGADACKYDSGGPLVHNGTQYGIVSFGKECATPYPGVYAKVSALRSWIDDKLVNTGARAEENEINVDLKTGVGEKSVSNDLKTEVIENTAKVESASEIIETTAKVESASEIIETKAKKESVSEVIETKAKVESASEVIETKAKVEPASEVIETTAKVESASEIIETTAKVESASEVIETKAKVESASEVIETAAKVESASEVIEKETKDVKNIEIKENSI